MSQAQGARPDRSFLLGFVSILASTAVFFLLVVKNPTPPSGPEVVPSSLLASYDSIGAMRLRGVATARDTLTEITDFMCSACAKAHDVLGPLVDSLVTVGLLVHQVLEMPIQRGSIDISVVASCVWSLDNGSYWRYRSILFEAQRAVAVAYPLRPELVRLAAYATVDTVALEICLGRSELEEAVRFGAALTAARDAKIPFTPLFAVNGRVVGTGDVVGALAAVREAGGTKGSIP